MDSQSRSKIFIGSSTASKPITDVLNRLLSQKLPDTIEVIPWHLGVFGTGDYGPLEALDRILKECDFGIFVLKRDDITVRDGNRKLHSTRDNVIFELGLFRGRLGRRRAFMLYDADNPPDLPTDLTGTIGIPYFVEKNGGILEAAIDEACQVIVKAVEREGSLSQQHLEGIVRVHPTFPREKFFDFLRTSNQVTILQTWTPDIAYGISNHRDDFLRNGAYVKIYLLAPGKLATQRGIEQTDDETWGDEQIQITVRYLGRLRKQIGENIDVRLYSKLPSLAVYRCTGIGYDIAFLGNYLKKAKAIEKPFLEIDLNQSNLWKTMIEKEIMEIDDGAEPPAAYPELKYM